MVLPGQPASNLQLTLGLAPSKCSELVQLEPLPQGIRILVPTWSP